jgi:hypothetical protein
LGGGLTMTSKIVMPHHQQRAFARASELGACSLSCSMAAEIDRRVLGLEELSWSSSWLSGACYCKDCAATVPTAHGFAAIPRRSSVLERTSKLPMSMPHEAAAAPRRG